MSLRIFLNRELLLLAIFFLVLLIELLLLALEILGATQAALLDIGRGIVNEDDGNEEEENDGTLECLTMLDVSTVTSSLFLCCRLTPSCNGGIVVEY